MIVLDSNALIYWGQGRLPVAGVQARLGASIISKLEVLSWPELTSRDEQVMLGLLAEIELIGLDDQIVNGAIRLRRERRIRLPDAIIAATALHRGATLWTYDKAFLGLENIEVVAPPLMDFPS